MSHYLLSKSSYIKGLQCPKALFYYKHYPQYRDPISPSKQALFNRGHEVGALARKLFPGGVDATEKTGPKSKKVVEKTAQLMAEGVNVIYEAAFVADQVLVLVDILVRDGDPSSSSRWKAFEVKSSLRLSNAYFRDAELQFHVLKKAGLDISDFSLIHVNGDYVLNGKLDLKKYFRIVSIKRTAEENFNRIGEKIAAHKEVLKLKQEPDIKIGEQCFVPYECDYKGHCWKNVPEGNVFELSGLSRGDQAKYFNAGYVFPEQIPDSEPLPVLARLQAHVRVSKEVIIVKERIREWLSQFPGSVMFTDIESYQPAIPQYEGTWPFQALSFAFSLHKRDENGNLSYYSFIAEPGADPRKDFLNAFLDATAGEEPILAYDLSAEKTALNMLRKKFPERGEEVDQRVRRLRDLKQPFAEGWYYHPEMKGSISLKYVLPALVPELSHETLEITNGNHAMSVYATLQTSTDIFEIAESKTALEEYIKLDTLAMVKVFGVLENAIRS